MVQAGAELLIDKAHIKHGNRFFKDRFDVKGKIELGEVSNGIDVLNEDLIVTFDDFSETIPAGSFFRIGKGFLYIGSLGGITLISIKDNEDFSVLVTGVDVNINLNEPVFFSLQIGNDLGETEIQFNNNGHFH